MRWTIKFASQPDKDYEYAITPGWTETRTLSEELDSAVIALGHVTQSNRLSDLQPFEFCRIFNRTDGTSSEWLVDAFQEDEVDSTGHVYRYQITLMSETKLLEKIQLPNIALTYDKISTPTIEKEIQSLWQRYMPFVPTKTENGTIEARKLISLAHPQIDGLDQQAKDVNLNAPTLREAITVFTTQIGCLPIVNDRQLSYVDLRKAGETDFKEIGLTSVSRSNSSDAYTTRLETQTDRMIDVTGSGVRTETTTFRDPDNAVLRLDGNACLMVDFPIMKIDQVLASTYGYVRPALGPAHAMNGNNVCYAFIYGENMKNGSNADSDDDDNNGGEATTRERVKFTMRFKSQTSTRDGTGQASTAKIYDFQDGQDITLYYQALHCENLNYETVYSSTAIAYNVRRGSGNEIEATFTIEQRPRTNNYLLFCFVKYDHRDVINGPVTDTQEFLALVGTQHSLFPTKANEGGGDGSYLSKGASVSFQKAMLIKPSIDITLLFKRADERRLLSTDWTEFEKISHESTLKGNKLSMIAKYYFSTFGYEVGDNRIGGFGDKFNTLLGWWTNEHTAGEVIYEWFINTYGTRLINEFKSNFNVGRFWELIFEQGQVPEELQKALLHPPGAGSIAGGEGATQFWGFLQLPTEPEDYTFVLESTTDGGEYNNIGDAYDGVTDPSYLQMVFAITYKPISVMNIQSLKARDEELIPIRNYDSPSDAYANFNDFMIAERDKVNRLGEDTILINQRVRSEDNLSEVGSRFREHYIVYRREISHYEDFALAQYCASRDSVAKNFSTALQRKYRAYRNVDYNQSVTRLENRTLFAYIYVTEDLPGAFGEEGQPQQPAGIFTQTRTRVGHPVSLLYCNTYQEPIRKAVEGRSGAIFDDAPLYQFDVSTASYDNGIVLSMLERDNATFGNQMLISDYNEDVGDGVGGVPQQWVELPTQFRERHVLAFTSADKSIIQGDASVGYDFPELPYTWQRFIDHYPEPETIVYFDYTSEGSFAQEAIVHPDQDLAEKVGYTLQIEFWHGDIPRELARINWKNFARFQSWIRNPNEPEKLEWYYYTGDAATPDKYFNEGDGPSWAYDGWTAYPYSQWTLGSAVNVEDLQLGGTRVESVGQDGTWLQLVGTDPNDGKRYDILALRCIKKDTVALNVQLTEFKTKRHLEEDEEGYVRFENNV